MLRGRHSESFDLQESSVSLEDDMMANINKSSAKSKQITKKKSIEHELAELEMELYSKAEELAQKTPPQQLSKSFEMSPLEEKAPDEQTREFIRIVEFIQKSENKNNVKNSENDSSRPKLPIHYAQIRKYNEQFKFKEPEQLKKQKGLQLNKAV